MGGVTNFINNIAWKHPGITVKTARFLNRATELPVIGKGIRRVFFSPGLLPRRIPFLSVALSYSGGVPKDVLELPDENLSSRGNPLLVDRAFEPELDLPRPGNKISLNPGASSSPIGAENRPNNPYEMALRRLLTGSEVTPESTKRWRILNKIGPEAERYVQTLYGNPNIKIVIAPYGSTLKGYADEESDLEYAIYIVSGVEKEPVLDRSVRRIHIHEGINNLINSQQEGVKAEDMISVLPIMNLSDITRGNVRGSLLGGELDAWHLMHLFLPIAYGDSSLIEQCRKNVIAYFSEKGQEGQETWASIQRVYAKYVAIREGDINLKPHLRDWVARQGVTSLEDFNKARPVGLPDLKEMIHIYGILGTVSHRDAPSSTQLSLDEKTFLIGQKHENSYSVIQRKYNLDPFIYSMTNQEGAKDIISWLYENGYLDSSKKFCDPFMGNGLLVHLAHVMTGADSTGYEKDSRIHQEAVRISTELTKLGVVDAERIHFILGSSSSVSLEQYDVFYIYPPWEDGIPNPMLVWSVIANMKIGAIMVLTIGIDPTSIYYQPLRLEDHIEKIANIRGGVVYRRISRFPTADVGSPQEKLKT